MGPLQFIHHHIISALRCLIFIPMFAMFAMPAQGQAAQTSPQMSSGSGPSSGKAKASVLFDQVSKRADAARQANQIPEAIDLYQKALRLNPRWDEGLWYMGSLYYDTDHYTEAVPVFRQLVEVSPTYGPGWAMLGLCEFETHDFKNSILHLQRGRSLGFGGNEELVNVTRYHEAILLNTLAEFEESTQILSSLIGRGVVSENVKVALGMAELRVPLFPNQVDPSKDALIHAAGEVASLVAMNNFDQAEEGFKQMLKDFPNTPFLHYAYGNTLLTLARFDDAEKQFQEELKITPDSPFPYMQLASLKLRTNRFDEALALAQSAVRIAPNAFPAHYLLGRARLELGDVPEAIKELEIARRLGSYSPEVHYNLARAYAKAHRKEDAERERKEFATLNGLEQQKLGREGPQSYRSSSDRGMLGPREVNAPAAPPPPHPR